MGDLSAALRFLLGLSLRTHARRLAVSLILLLSGNLAAPLAALALKGLTDAALGGHARAALWWGVVAATSLVSELMLGHFAHLFYFELGESLETALTAELMDTVNGRAGLGDVETPQFAGRLGLVRDELSRLYRALEAVLQLVGLLAQLAFTMVVLGLLDGWLLLLPLAAIPPVFTAARAQRIVETAREATAESSLLARQLLETVTTAEPVREVRLAGAGEQLFARHDEAWSQLAATLGRAQARAAAVRASGQLVFALAYGAAILFVLRLADRGQAPVGDMILVIALTVQVSLQIANALKLLETLQGAGSTARGIAALRETGASREAGAHESCSRDGGAHEGSDRHADGAALPDRLAHGIELRDVGFRYPGTDRFVLRHVTLRIPAAGTMALVGDNGAGKSTLVKLLCGLYRPTEGRILVDGVDLAELAPQAWRDRIAVLFQDFVDLELRLRDDVGAGAVGSIDDDDAVTGALDRAHALPLAARVPGGLDGLLGSGYGDGTELSGGQWQSLALARALMRTRPLLLVLDEPAAALDAAAEHALFERYGSAARQAGAEHAAVTVFVSHRFSTVSMADLIVVLDEGRVAEHGDHSALIAAGGRYAELSALQAYAYRGEPASAGSLQGHE
jgi:ATP-binding cassette, subfamily B, bacterial